jgi:oxygen-independent coproporphyrinogen III oxidase
MAGIYIHIPFCKQACTYCDFYFLTSGKYIDRYLDALIVEITLRKQFLNDEKVKTIYFGGGTPSILPTTHLQRILTALYQNFDIEDHAEVSLEINPDDVSPQKIQEWKSTSINRFSVGIQCFQDELLQWMNRSHSKEQALSSVKRLQDAGFVNLSADLIYGIPGLSDVMCKSNIQTIIELDIPHISCYCLTVEEKTPLWHPSDSQGSEQFNIIMEETASNAYTHYEISNFSKPSCESKHNSNYWNYVPYLGLGPAAHSFDRTTRYSNISNIHRYVEELSGKKLGYIHKEELTESERVNERILIQLRLDRGIRLQDFDTDIQNELKNKSEKWINKALVLPIDTHIRLSNKGKHYADHIAQDLFVNR